MEQRVRERRGKGDRGLSRLRTVRAAPKADGRVQRRVVRELRRKGDGGFVDSSRIVEALAVHIAQGSVEGEEERGARALQVKVKAKGVTTLQGWPSQRAGTAGVAQRRAPIGSHHNAQRMTPKPHTI